MKNNSTKTNLTKESVSKGRKLNTKSEAVDKYANLLYCADCGYPLVMNESGSKDRCYCCFRYQNSDGKFCMPHRISEKQLDRTLLQVLQCYAEAARTDPEKFRKQIFSELYQSDCLEVQSCHGHICQRQRKITVINHQMKELSVKYPVEKWKKKSIAIRWKITKPNALSFLKKSWSYRKSISMNGSTSLSVRQTSTSISKI